MNALKLVVLTGLVLLAAQITGWRLLDHLFYTLAGILGLAWLLSRLARRGLVISRTPLTDRGQVGHLMTEHLRLENQSRLPKLWVEVLDRSTLPGHQAGLVTRLRGHGQQRWTVTTPLTRRGRYMLGPLRLRTSDPFGLFPVEQSRRGTFEILVYPATVPLHSVGLVNGDLPGGDRSSQRSPHVTPHVSGLRDYRPGDSLNRIAWSATARYGRMMAKEFDLDPTTDLWLITDMAHWAHLPLDIRVPWLESISTELWRDSTEEFSVSVTASLAQHLLKEHRSVGLLMAGQRYQAIPTDRGQRQLIKLLEALAVVRASGERGLGELLMAEAARFSRRSSLIIVTPTTDESWVPALSVLQATGVRAAVVLIDASSFGGPTSPLLVVGQLAAQRIPTLIVRRQDDLAELFGQPPPTMSRSPRWQRPEGW